MTREVPVGQDPARAEIAFDAEGCVFASYLNVGIAIFSRRVPLAAMAELRKVTSDLAREYGRTSTLYYAINDVPLPAAPVRDAMQALTSELAQELVAVASVIHGDGFWASAIRGFATSVHWVRGHEYKKRVFSRSDEAVHWLAPLHSERSLFVSAADLEGEIARLLALPSLQSDAAVRERR